MAKSICYDFRTDILMHRNDVSAMLIPYFDGRCFFHHRAKRSGYVRESYCLMRAYSGRFGVGYMLVSNAGHGNVWVDYYLKGE